MDLEEYGKRSYRALQGSDEQSVEDLAGLV
jgi:hypothetical protein